MNVKNHSHNLVLLSIVFLAFYGCGNKALYTETSTNTVPLIMDYKVPQDLPTNASQEDIANFAWNQFFALNWKAAWSQENQTRFNPDMTWTPSDSTPELAVWETYAHRIELRPGDGMRTDSLETGMPDYTFVPNLLDTIVSKMTQNGNKNINSFWNILDEDNEIGSTYLFKNKGESEVLYMAKTNLSEYNYVKAKFPNDSLLKVAENKKPSLFGTLTKEQMCGGDAATEGYVCLPCGDTATDSEGAIEIKLAFIELKEGESQDRYITKQAISFTKEMRPDTVIFIPTEKTFGLIGMHIIHKTKNHPNFVFASWEQVDVRNKNYQTLGIDQVQVDNELYTNEDPHRLNPVIERNIPEVIRKVNQNAKNLITYKNANSKWQYYQLIGTQATPTKNEDRTDDSNYFMANYVIESDLTLTNFHGSFSDPFDTDIQNVALNKETYNMGGCMGCHGSAQKTGSDFSFLLDFGAGKPVKIPDVYQTYQEAFIAVNSSKSFTSIVSAKKGWIDSGIIVKPGDSIISVTGSWTTNTRDTPSFGANGIVPEQIANTTDGFPLPNKNIGALIGKIGNNTPFLIGANGTEVKFTQTGPLYFSINDYPAALYDNAGAQTVKIGAK